MIIPWLKGIQIRDLPLTWVLLILNLIFFVVITDHDTKYNFKNDLKTKDQIFMTAGKLATQVYKDYELPFWHRLFNYDLKEHEMVLGSYALRQDSFLEKIKTTPTVSDHLEKQQLIEFLEKLEAYKENSQGINFALQPHATTPWTWITYQFTHSDFFHLFSNMVFMVLFGLLIEAQFGGAILALVYIMGGICGGLFFLLQLGNSPVVGASASASALIAFYIVSNWGRKIPMLYFLAPVKGYMGLIYLPTFVLVPFLLFDDFLEVLSSVDGLTSGVAHSAHVGGMLFGIVFALILRAYARFIFRWSESST